MITMGRKRSMRKGRALKKIYTNGPASSWSGKKSIPRQPTEQTMLAKANENAWFKLVGKPALSLPCSVTLRLPEEGLELPTKITIAATDPDCQFYLIGIEQWRFLATIVLFFLILWFLVWLARTTDILRDSSGRVRADGLEPVSLGRTQMAFWFILTVGAWAFLLGHNRKSRHD